MKRNNYIKNALKVLLCIVILIFVSIVYKIFFLYGSGVIEGRNIDKEYQRSQISKYYMAGHIIEVSTNNIKIELDTIVPHKATFPHEYIPPYDIIIKEDKSYIIINTDRIKVKKAENGMYFKKEIGRDCFYIGIHNYPLFD